MLGGVPDFRRNGAGGMGGSSIPGLGQLLGGFGGGPSPMANPGGLTAFGPGGGMDVMGSLKKNSDFGTQFVGNPGSGPGPGGFGGRGLPFAGGF